MRPSAESDGAVAESLKFVSWINSDGEVTGPPGAAKRQTSHVAGNRTARAATAPYRHRRLSAGAASVADTRPPGVSIPASAADRSNAIAPADWYRLAGSFSRARATIPTISGDRPGNTSI